MTDYKNKPGPSTSEYGPGWPGNTASSPSQDTPLPTRVNQGDAGDHYCQSPWMGSNSQNAGAGEVSGASPGTSKSVQKQTINEPHGTYGKGTTANPAPIGK